MKTFSQNRTLYIAIAVSVLVHVVLLSARFGFIGQWGQKPASSTMELVIVSPAPPKGRQSQPMEKVLTEDIAVTSSKNAAVSSKLEANQAKTESSRTEKSSGKMQQATSSAVPRDRIVAATGNSETSGFRLGTDDGRSVVFRQNRGNNAGATFQGTDGVASGGRPVITASTKDVGYSMYYKALRRRVENMGLINFPQQNGERLYGELTVRIPVYHDGTLYEKEGGASIERSSGNRALDRAAINIIRRAAPFGPFPKSMRTKNGGADVWIIITRLNFTREQGTRSQVQTTVH